MRVTLAVNNPLNAKTHYPHLILQGASQWPCGHHFQVRITHFDPSGHNLATICPQLCHILLPTPVVAHPYMPSVIYITNKLYIRHKSAQSLQSPYWTDIRDPPSTL